MSDRDKSSSGMKTTNRMPEQSLSGLPTMKLDQKGIGQVDRYELLEKLGEGGFGAVYGAKDTVAGILVALKALPSEVSCDVEEMASIRDNFALVSRLSHPNIAGVKHLHKVENPDGRTARALGIKRGDYLVVMEYAPGATLFNWRRALPEQKMDFFQALEICRQVAEALDYAHSQRVLHRDVKPKNVMVSFAGHDSLKPLKSSKPLKSGDDLNEAGGRFNERSDSTFSTVKVLDFGLAAEIRSSMSRMSKETKISKSGTPNYMAPEQWEGKRQDGRADQYALAALFYELVCGEVPFKSAFDSGNFGIMRNAVTNNPIEPIQELTRQQNAVLQRALAKNPQKRFRSCSEFIGALGGQKSAVRDQGRRQRAEDRHQKSAIANRKSAMLIGLLVAGLLGAGVWVTKSAIGNRQSAIQQAQQSAETQAQIFTLMREAQTALAADDLDAATEKAQSVLKLDANHSAAAELLLEVEKKAGEIRAREAKIDAELAAAKLERDITDRAQGFGEKFEALKKDLLIAQDAYSLKSWGQAFMAFKGVAGSCDALRALDVDRKDAKTQRTGMESARKGAEGAKADQLAKKEWDGAVGAALEAARAFEEGRFEEASKGWKTAGESFQGSEEMAGAISLYRKAKEEWESRKTDNGEQITDNQLRQYATDLFGEAEKAARLGEAAASEPVIGKQHYDAALANYAEAVKKTEPHLVPRLGVECNVAGVEITVAATDGRDLRPPTAAKDWTLEKGKTYTLTVSKKRYKTYTAELTADWKGLKTKLVVLEAWNGPEEGENWTADLGGGVKMAFVPVAAGSFMMGSENGDADEKPAHRVTLTKLFWMAKTEVTQAQYKQITGSNPSKFNGDDLPVEQVSWNDAVSFCEKMTARERQAGRLPKGYEYTLPTEAQWEYACRAGTTGDCAGVLDSTAWYSSNSGSKTHAVGTKQPNAWGLYDMHGNVWEWCADWHGDYPSGSVTDPQGVSAGLCRVSRGGGWCVNSSFFRLANRYSDSPEVVVSLLGFRPVVSAVTAKQAADSAVSVQRPAVPVQKPAAETTGTPLKKETGLVSLGPQKGKNWTVDLGGGVKMAFMPIAEGSFMMGSTNGAPDEMPVHRVTLTKPFWMAKTEVTQAQYKQITGSNPSGFKGDDLPVEKVRWSDAVEFCRKLTARERQAGRLPEGFEYTLPTEAQWEYACRSGTTGDYAASTGSGPAGSLDSMGWYDKNSGSKTHPAGTKQANAWGLYDMHGNVWEWCADWYDSGTYNQGRVTDPRGASSGSGRVIRGGGWFNLAPLCRSANRLSLLPDYSSNALGFRPLVSAVAAE